MRKYQQEETALEAPEKEEGTNSNSDNGNNTAQTGHVNYIWSGNFPASKGKVTNEFGKYQLHSRNNTPNNY
eukprot:7796524-Ditylum_brightwellii.AAC.1